MLAIYPLSLPLQMEMVHREVVKTSSNETSQLMVTAASLIHEHNDR
jgi:hypothetical protein